jgi:Uma2 family endonuclease
MSTQPRPFVTPSQYLAMDRAAPYRSEYYDGAVFPMEAATLNHARITGNVQYSLRTQLSGRACEVLSSSLRVQAQSKGPYFYPDIVIFCGQPKTIDDWKDMVADATVIIEVSSPSTKYYDRSEKFEQYRRLPSLTDYLVISQDRRFVEHWAREIGNPWTLFEFTDPEGVIQLSSIGCTLRIADVYAGVDF